MTQKINKKLIGLEGPDGIGKSTQTKLLTEFLQDFLIEKESHNIYIRTKQFKELNDSDFIFAGLRQFVYSIYKKVPTTTLAEIIKLNRYLVYDNMISDYTCDYDQSRGELNSKIVYNKYVAICDRWNISTYAYLKAEGYEQEALSYLLDDKTVIPGLTIMLVGNKGVSRTKNRSENNNMFEDREDDYNQKLADTYINFDESLYAGKVVKINNDKLSKNETQEIIRETVVDYLNTVFS